MSWEPKTPLEFAAFFAAMWVVMALLLSFVGGWMALARNYRLSDTFVGKKWYLCSASFRRFVSYGGVLTIGANGQGLYLAVWVPLLVAHPPLLVPWHDVRRAKPGLFSIFNDPLELGGESPVRVSISKRLVRKLEEIAGHELPTAV